MLSNQVDIGGGFDMNTVYVLIRTSNRPAYFDRCIESVEKQRGLLGYSIEVIVGNDNNDEYCKRYNPVLFSREPVDIDATFCNTYLNFRSIDTAKYFPFNGYLNKMLERCTKQGWVIILDDDDYFTSKTSVSQMLEKVNSDQQVLFWRVNICGNIIPSDSAWGKAPQKRNISMIGFMFNTKYIPLIHIAPYKQADFRLAHQLYGMCDPIFLNKILTQTDNEGQGRQMDL